MVVCPLDKTVVWVCSLYKKPSNDFKQVVQGYDLIYHIKYYIDVVCIICKLLLIISDFSAINVLGGRFISSSHTLRWVQPKVFRSWGCGYYVMHWMKTIVQAHITDSWEHV